MKLGLVTYNLAATWDLDTLLAKCAQHRFEGVELRTTHPHKVEVDLTPAQRAEVKAKFADSPVALVGLGSAFEYHSLDPEEVKRNTEGTKEYIKLAADLGCPGVKVRPNGLQLKAGVPKEQTLTQIGLAYRACAAFGADHGVELRMEVHGPETCKPENLRAIIDAADHPNALVCWNCNPEAELKSGSIKESFDLLSPWIRLVHLRDLYPAAYPTRELLGLLKGIGYQGYCLAEIQGSEEPDRLMDYYRAVWDAYCELEGC